MLFRGGRRVIVDESVSHATTKINIITPKRAALGFLVHHGQHVNFLLSAVGQRRVPELAAVRRITGRCQRPRRQGSKFSVRE